ncbi:class I SAM-dependent methyltransferase [Streptomyces erythrochromogenes]|uniref:class I SAM-dependent methyltransferase n=1 Tax=Streptomyces erythrochromogenes TaxID=285574 RepID=UPI0038053D89
MSEAAEKFETAMPAWKQWQEAPWGRLRYAIAEANLLRHFGERADEPLRVLDLAGGDDGDALRLAVRGHHVTIADYAPAMLTAAAGCVAAAGLTDLVSCVEADANALPADIVRGEFDVVLCHNLLQYVE